jgi:hypothetical protein
MKVLMFSTFKELRNSLASSDIFGIKMQKSKTIAPEKKEEDF